MRLPELEAYGINSKTLEIFNPLKEYWAKYVSPKIKEVIETLPVSFCDLVKADDIKPITPEQNNVEISGNTTDHSEL